MMSYYNIYRELHSFYEVHRNINYDLVRNIYRVYLRKFYGLGHNLFRTFIKTMKLSLNVMKMTTTTGIEHGTANCEADWLSTRPLKQLLSLCSLFAFISIFSTITYAYICSFYVEFFVICIVLKVNFSVPLKK